MRGVGPFVFTPSEAPSPKPHQGITGRPLRTPDPEGFLQTAAGVGAHTTSNIQPPASFRPVLTNSKTGDINLHTLAPQL